MWVIKDGLQAYAFLIIIKPKTKYILKFLQWFVPNFYIGLGHYKLRVFILHKHILKTFNNKHK